MPEYSKDTIIAVLGASVGLAGLLLVVAGYVFSQINSFPSENTDDTVIKNYEIAGIRASICSGQNRSNTHVPDNQFIQIDLLLGHHGAILNGMAFFIGLVVGYKADSLLIPGTQAVCQLEI